MKETWTETIRRKLEGHRKPPPKGLWEGISEQMGFQLKTTGKPAPSRKWYWAAAATILVLGGFFALYHQDSTSTSSQTVTNILKSKDIPQSETTETHPEEFSSEQPVPQTVTPSPVLAEAHISNDQTTSDVTVQEHNETIDKEPKGTIEKGLDNPKVAIETDKEQDEKIENGKKTEESHPIVTDQNNLSDVGFSERPIHQHSLKTGKWTMGLQASGGLLANNSTHSVKNYVLFEGAEALSGFYANNGYVKYENYLSKHHLPVRLGMSLQYQLNDRLALLTGANYTWLYSEFTNENTNIDQHLHYLGVPVGVAYQLWSNHHLQCYLSGIVLLEKCLNEKPWQWSVEAGAGAEYAITDKMGLYLEPSLGYYFDDGTSFEHYYKDHPLSPSIQFGLRMHIK